MAAVSDGMAALKRRFCDDEYEEGFEKAGKVVSASEGHSILPTSSLKFTSAE